MKRPRFKIGRCALWLSLAINLFVALPALLIFSLSDGIRFYVYEQAAARVGDTEIVFIGDSITRDGGIWGLRIGEPFFNVRNLGHAAIYTEQMPYQAQIAVAEKARIAFVMAGINDLPKTTEGAEKSFENYARLLDILVDGGVQPIVQSTLYRAGGVDREFVASLNEKLRQHAEANGIAFLDLNALLADENGLKPEFTRDGTHLTEAAYGVWSDKLREYLGDQPE